MNKKNGLLLLLLVGLCSSCQFFTTERISSDTFYEEEIESIDWNDVDSYPAFPDCERLIEKKDQKQCFQKILHEKIKTQIMSEKWVTPEKIQDTALVIITISATGEMSLNPVQMGSLTYLNVPQMDASIQKVIEGLPKVSPALKRGIPVNTMVILPIILNSEEL